MGSWVPFLLNALLFILWACRWLRPEAQDSHSVRIERVWDNVCKQKTNGQSVCEWYFAMWIFFPASFSSIQFSSHMQHIIHIFLLPRYHQRRWSLDFLLYLLSFIGQSMQYYYISLAFRCLYWIKPLFKTIGRIKIDGIHLLLSSTHSLIHLDTCKARERESKQTRQTESNEIQKSSIHTSKQAYADDSHYTHKPTSVHSFAFIYASFNASEGEWVRYLIS